MTRRYVTDLKDGDIVDEVFLVADKQLRANRNAALYLTVDLRDRTGVVNGRMWNVMEESCNHIQIGGFARAGVQAANNISAGNIFMNGTIASPSSS